MVDEDWGDKGTDEMAVKIGVVSIQGDFDEHYAHLVRGEEEGVEVYRVRTKKDLMEREYDGLLFPGGESTTYRRVMQDDPEFFEEFKRLILTKKVPSWGTCCGLIIFAKSIGKDSSSAGDEYKFSCMDISVIRNAYGSQNDSFISPVTLVDKEQGLDCTVEGLFIRAPAIESVGEGVSVIASLPATFKYPIVGVRKDNLLATTFHPELTGSRVFHDYFIGLARQFHHQ